MQPSPYFLETLKHGITKQIDVGALAAKEVRTYDENASPLKEIVRTFGTANFLKVLNMSLTITLKVSLDGVPARSDIYPGGFVQVTTDIQFRSITIENMTSNVSLGDEIYLVVAYQPPQGSPISIAGLK